MLRYDEFTEIDSTGEIHLHRDNYDVLEKVADQYINIRVLNTVQGVSLTPTQMWCYCSQDQHSVRKLYCNDNIG